MKELYLYKSFDELSREAHINLIHYKPVNLYPAAEKAFHSGLRYLDNGDEEMAFILFHRFNLIYRHLESTDPCFLKQRLIGEFNTASGLLVDLRTSLLERYIIRNRKTRVALESVITETRTSPTATKEADILTFPSGFVNCRDLYRLLTNKDVDIIIFDTRSEEDFSKSQFKYSKCVNIPEECIETGLSAHVLGKKLPKESKSAWERRWKCHYLVFYDWSSTRDTMATSKLSVLKHILLKWDPTELKNAQILILNGGYIEWLQTYPMMSTNPDVIYDVQNDALDELLDLESIEYPVARVLKPPSLQPIINRATKPGSATISPMPLSSISPRSIISSDTSDMIIDLTLSEDEGNKRSDDPLDIFDLGDNRTSEDVVKDDNKPLTDTESTASLVSKTNGSDISNSDSLRSLNMLKMLQEAREHKKMIPKATPKVNRAIKPTTRPTVVERGYTGLKNLGSTCYMNSVLQILLHTPHLYNYFLDDTLDTSNVGSLAKHFQKFFVNMWSGNFKCVAPKDLRNTFTARERSFIGSDHQDAQDFMYSFNNQVHDDLGVDIVRPVQPAWTPKEQCFIRDTSGKISIITDTFVGQYMAKLECESCSYKSTNYENFQTVGLTLNSSCNNLRDCIAFSERRNRIYHCTCGRCKKETAMLIAHKLYTIAPVIVFTALRFRLDSADYIKNDTPFTFPLESLTFQSDVIYDLYGVVVHRGNMNFGHYIALVKHCLTGVWIRCDDEQVTQVDVKEVLRATDAYMLFYGERGALNQKRV